MTYSDQINVNKNFQTSINLELDFCNEAKINEYIPTPDICDVLEKYIDSISGTSTNRATTLVGPYGKGKSFILLILSYLISGDTHSSCYKKLLSKIKRINTTLFDKIKSLRDQGSKLLTIIVNSNYDDLNQAFLLALNDALVRSNLTDIIPETAFSSCLDLLNKWTANKEFSSGIAKKCKEINSISIKKLKQELNMCSVEAYNSFKELYRCVTGGLEFNPLVNNDIVKKYKDITCVLSDYGYSGIFIIFDEFSKFIESDGNNLMHDLKVIQDFAELASRTGKTGQVHLCCVTHKSLALYGTNRNQNIVDSFKTVEGRFKEIKFNRSLEENYQIISSAIQKKSTYVAPLTFIKDNVSFYERATERLGLENKAEKEALFYGCYPLNPNTVYALINLSELVAQNERTLFTFLSDTDENGFNSFIHKENDGLLNLDKLYDYFSPLLKKEESNSIREIWYRAESTLDRVIDEKKKGIIKALAIILMINDNKLSPMAECINDCLFSEIDSTQSAIREMCDNHFLKMNDFNHSLSFASSNSKEIDEAIARVTQTGLKRADISGICSEINEEKYLLPRRYNEENKITRFFRSVFLSEQQFKDLKDFSLIKEEEFSDGIVINLLSNTIKPEEIQEKVNEIGDRSVIVRSPASPIVSFFTDELLRCAALKELTKTHTDDSVFANEISLLYNEAKEDLQSLLASYFSDSSPYYTYCQNSSSFHDCLSDSLDSVFFRKTIFNNELANKTKPSTQYTKTISHVIDWILNGKNSDCFEYSETSPEETTRKSIVNQFTTEGDVKSAILEVEKKIIDCNEDKISVAELTNYLANPNFGYGIRDGIIPLLIAQALLDISINDNVILYYKTQEIDLNASNLLKATSRNNDGYYFGYSKGSKEEAYYIQKMCTLFALPKEQSFRDSVKSLSIALRKYFLGLPNIIRNSKQQNNYLGLPIGVINYMSYFQPYNINPFEVIFKNAKKAFDCSSLIAIYDQLAFFKAHDSEYVPNFIASINSKLRNSLSIGESTSLKTGLNKHLDSICKGNKAILTDSSRNLYNVIKDKLNYNDIETINQLCFATTGHYCEDWETDESERLIQETKAFFEELKTAKQINLSTDTLQEIEEPSPKELSPIAKLLANSFEEILDEYGESVSNEEKVSILTGLLKKMF